MELGNHELVPGYPSRSIRCEGRPLEDRERAPVAGRLAVGIALDDDKQRKAYADRRAVGAVLTGTGGRASCTGGDTAEHATLDCRRKTLEPPAARGLWEEARHA